MEYPRILLSGDCAFIVEFGNSINTGINRKVKNFTDALQRQHIKGIIDVIPTFRSILINYDPRFVSYKDLQIKLEKLLKEPLPEIYKKENRTIEIPVCYGGDYGPDLKDVAEYASMSEKEVISLHSSKDYLIYMLGFLPGFAYLGGMDSRLNMPRLVNPKLRIKAGSVAIGGAQTGIYPLDSPGGWRVIGRTPVRIYDPERKKPILYKAGDCIRFVPIGKKDFLDIKKQSAENQYTCKLT